MDMLMFLIFAICILGFFLPSIRKKYDSSMWRLVYVAPLILAVMISIFIEINIGYAGMYLAVILMLFVLFTEKTALKKIITAAAAVSVMVSIICIMGLNMGAGVGYTKDFEDAFAVMKQHYVLTEEKAIDWDSLYAKYHPLFEKAEKEGDGILNYKNWLQFTQEFYDGHVGYLASDQRLGEMADCEIFGNDYGLSLLRLTSGEYVAVNVEGSENSLSILDYGEDYEYAKDHLSDNAQADRLQLLNAGIHNGTVITSWDGKSIEELKKEVDVYVDAFPSKDNEEFYLSVYAAGKGADSVKIGFIDDSGTEKSVTAKKLGAYYPRMISTVKKLDNGVNISNLDMQSVDSDTALLRIYQMAYDAKSYAGSDYTEMTEEVRQKVLEYRDKGYKRLIIDLRRNGGGSPFMVGAVVQLFAPEGEHLISYSAVINEKTATYERGTDGKYVKDKKMSYMGENLWDQGDIILLVNYETVSAGDMMTSLMSEYPNVTIMGFTGSNSSCQAVTSCSMRSGGVTFSAVPNLGEDGEMIIDTRADRVRGVPIDHVIPLTGEAITAIFDKGEDYLLDYAANY